MFNHIHPFSPNVRITYEQDGTPAESDVIIHVVGWELDKLPDTKLSGHTITVFRDDGVPLYSHTYIDDPNTYT